MKTNGSTLRRQWKRKLSGRDGLGGHPCSRPCISCSHTSCTPGPFSAHQIRQPALHVNRVIPAGWKSSWNISCVGECTSPRWATASEWGVTAASLMASLTPVFAVSRPSATVFVLTLLCALFTLLYFTAFFSIHHVEKTCRRNRSEPGTGYPNPLMGSTGYAALMEHWFKASSICQFIKLQGRKHTPNLILFCGCTHFEFDYYFQQYYNWKWNVLW